MAVTESFQWGGHERGVDSSGMTHSEKFIDTRSQIIDGRDVPTLCLTGWKCLYVCLRVCLRVCVCFLTASFSSCCRCCSACRTSWSWISWAISLSWRSLMPPQVDVSSCEHGERFGQRWNMIKLYMFNIYQLQDRDADSNHVKLLMLVIMWVRLWMLMIIANTVSNQCYNSEQCKL